MYFEYLITLLQPTEMYVLNVRLFIKFVSNEIHRVQKVTAAVVNTSHLLHYATRKFLIPTSFVNKQKVKPNFRHMNQKLNCD